MVEGPCFGFLQVAGLPYSDKTSIRILVRKNYEPWFHENVLIYLPVFADHNEGKVFEPNKKDR